LVLNYGLEKEKCLPIPFITKMRLTKMKHFITLYSRFSRDKAIFQLRLAIPIVLIAWLVPESASASTVFINPTPQYLAKTQVVGFSDPDEALLNSISTGGLKIGFSTPMRASTVRDNWATWGTPPKTESPSPKVLWTGLDDNFNPVTSMTFRFSTPVSIFGFEAEPGPTDSHPMTANFFMNGVLESTISQSVSGNADARLFAALADPGKSFDKVVVTSDADWAAGQFRFAPAFLVPVPPASGLFLTGLVALALLSNNLRRIS
jgi:hypothetical protein